MVPSLRFSDFRNDILNTMRFTECCDLKHGFQFRDEHFVSSGIPVIKIANLNYGGDIKLLPKSFVNQDEKFKKFELKQGDVLMALTGGTLGKTCKILENYGSLYQNYRVGKFVSKDNAIDAYIYFVLQSSLVQKRVKSLVNEAAQPNFGKQDFDKIKLALPKIEEQQKIASFLSSVDDKISQLEKKKTLLEIYKRGIMQKIFSQELRFKDENGQEFPDWKVNILGDLSDIRDGTHDSPKYIKSGFPLITSKNLSKSGGISFEDIKYISDEDYNEINKRSEVNIGDILFGMIGTIGNPVIVKSDGFAIKNVALIKEKKELMNTFMIHVLSSTNIKKQFYRLNTGNTQKFISLGLIRSLKIKFPSIAEQQKIASFLSTIDKKIEITSAQLQKTREFKKGLLQQMFV